MRNFVAILKTQKLVRIGLLNLIIFFVHLEVEEWEICW